MRQTLLITLGLSTALFASFSKNGNIVTDSTTGLQWQDNATGSTMTWTAAIDYCENLTLDGYSDWRLPNIKELASIVDDTKVFPSIDTSVFQNTASSVYYSSTTGPGYKGYAWRISFNSGKLYHYDKFYSLYVRCVRAGQ